MTEIFIITLMLVFSFLCGSIPSGYIIVKKIKGTDIRSQFSGNIGSTNVKRVAGVKASLLSQIMDISKGAIPVLLAIFITRYYEFSFDSKIFISLTGLLAILGHDFTPFLNFKGGKGVNTTIGSFIIIATIPTLIAIVTYFIFKKVSHIVSLSSILLGITLPIATGILNRSFPIFISSIFACILILIQHRSNIQRIMHGSEPKTIK
jgi:glycerol-3-phosphate acyltransferase PlsY